jgi:hypothetical protein
VISAVQVTKFYTTDGEAFAALDGVSVQINQGDFAIVMGRSGDCSGPQAGKFCWRASHCGTSYLGHEMKEPGPEYGRRRLDSFFKMRPWSVH